MASERHTEARRLAVWGYEHEWPPAFEALLARELVGRDAIELVRLGELTEAPELIAREQVLALVVQAERLGIKELLLLQECRRSSPPTAVVVVATTDGLGMKSALEGGATAFVSWPASADVLRQALRSGRGSAPAVKQQTQFGSRAGVVTRRIRARG